MSVPTPEPPKNHTKPQPQPTPIHKRSKKHLPHPQPFPNPPTLHRATDPANSQAKASKHAAQTRNLHRKQAKQQQRPDARRNIPKTDPPQRNEADFEALLNGLRTEYAPETEQHQLFIEQLAIAHWFLLRRERAYNAVETAIYQSAGNDPENLTEDHFRRLALAERYKVAAERALKRAFTNAESIRKERKSEHDHRERHDRWQAAQQLRERRLQIAEQKHKAAEAREAKDIAQQQAIRSILTPGLFQALSSKTPKPPGKQRQENTKRSRPAGN